MAIEGSKPYEIGGDKYSFAFQDGKLLGANKVDASNDFVSNAALDSAISPRRVEVPCILIRSISL